MESYSRQNYQAETFQRNNYQAVPLIRYSGHFLKWAREELKQMDQMTRKLMTMYKAVHPWEYVDIYVSGKEGGRGLANIEDSVYFPVGQQNITEIM